MTEREPTGLWSVSLAALAKKRAVKGEEAQLMRTIATSGMTWAGAVMWT